MAGVRGAALVAVALIGAVAVTAAGARSVRTIVIRDRVGDTRSRDLDVVRAVITRGRRRLTATIVVAGPIRDNVLYTVLLNGANGKLIGVSAEKSGGSTSFYALDPATFRRARASGGFARRSVTVSVSLKALRFATTERFSATVGSTSLDGRKLERDFGPLPVPIPP